MSRFHLLAVALVATAAGAVIALGAESDVKLKPGTGLDVVQSNCAACHSLDYIVINSPFLDAAAGATGAGCFAAPADGDTARGRAPVHGAAARGLCVPGVRGR